MSGGKSFKISPCLTYFFLAVCLTLTGFLFFSCFKSLVRAEVVDLPLNPLFTDCSVNPNSAPDDCRDAVPYGAYVDVSWNAQDCGGSCYYTILRNGNVAVSNLTQTSYKDRGLASLTEYTYKVRAYNQTGELKAETSATAAKTITTKNCGCPNPFNLISTNNDCAGNAAFIKVSWPKVMTGSIESTLYEIYRWEAVAPLNNYSSSYKIASISVAQAPYWNGANYSFEDSLIQPNTPYTYKVVAKSAGPARASANYLIQAAGPCPKPIITQLATNEPDCSPQPRITLQWEDCVNSSDALQCKQSRGSYYYLYKNNQLIPIALGGDCLCGGVTQKCCQWQNDKYNCCSDDTTLVNNVTYNYHIESQGPYWTLRSNTQSRILSCNAANVPRPDIFSVYPYCDGNAAKIILTWGYTTGAPPEIQFYYVYKFQCASSDLNTCLPVDPFPYALTTKQYYVDSNNVNPGKYYLYYVKAATNSNISQATDSSLILVLDCPTTTYPLPVKPNLTIARQCYNSNPRLALSWTPLKTDDVYTYYIFKNGNILTNTSLNSYTDEAVAAGQSYNYIIETISKGGWVDSSPASATARTDCDQPGPFVLNPLSAVCSDGKYNVTASWSSSENTSFYEIFSKFNDNTPPADCNDTNGLIGTANTTSYIHSGVNQAGTYSYFVRAKITDSAKCAFASFSDNDNSITLASPQPAAPATPTAVTECSGSQSIIKLSWPAVNGASSYKIYYTVDGATPTASSSNLDPGINTSYTHNVNPATTYRYKVQARNNCADSSLSEATNPITAIYCSPSSFTITGSAACSGDNNPAYTLSWTHSDSTVFKYDIYRNDNKIAEKTTSPFSPFGPDKPGQGSFTYYIKAINPAGARQSTNSYIANLDCSPPAAITNLAADPNVNCVSGYPVIKLTWTAPSGAVSYNIYRCQGCANPAAQGAKIAANLSSTSYNDTGGNGVAPLTGQTYSYQVETFKAANLSTSLSNLAQATARQCPLSSVTATLASSCAANNKPIFTINWTAPAPVSQLASYEIFRLNSQTASYGDFPATAFATVAASATSWSDSAVENSTWYSYYIKANILDGRTVDSNIVSGNYNCQPPPTATLSQVNALCDAAGKLYVDLVWILNDKSNVSYYQVYRNSALLVTINDKNQTTYQDWAVQSNQSYSYQIKACNSNNLCGVSSVLATNPNPTPYCSVGTPGNLVLTPSCILETPIINLNWQSALNATKYKVVRDGNIIYADLSALFKMDNSGIIGGNTFVYQIIAENPDYLCDSCTNCPAQCSSVQSIAAPACVISNPQFFAQRQCVGDVGNQYGNYSHLYWTADETPGAPIWCRLEKEEAENYAVKTLTFRSLGKYDSKIDNSSFTSQEITNFTYGAANEGSIYKSPSQSVRLAANLASSQPSYIGIYPTAFPGDGRDITLDFWFRLASFSCGDNTLRSLLWKDSGLLDATSNPLPDFRLSYNAQQNNEDDLANGSMVMLASAWSPSKIGETAKAVLKQGLNCDEWHHLIFTQDNNTADAQVYLDKTLSYQGNWSNNFTKTKNLYLGSGDYHEPGTTNWFQTPQLYFDNIKIWPDKIISQRQVDKLFDTPDNQGYETFYDDFAIQEEGVYNYKVVCHYIYNLSSVNGTATNVYYSVGQNTNNHSSGGNVSITSGVATFTVPQTAANLGVGDRLTAGGNVYYLTSKVSATVWNVVTKLGGVPADLALTVVTSIAHEFTSLSAAEAGASNANHLNTSNLVAGNYILNIPCYYDTAADTTAVIIDGWTTGASNYIKVYTPNNTSAECNTSQRHSGKWNEGKYRLEPINCSLTIQENYVVIDGLQIQLTSPGNYQNGISTAYIDGNGKITISNNIIKGNITNSGSIENRGIWCANEARFLIYNNIIYDFGNGDNYGIVGRSGIIYAYNNTITNCDGGFYSWNFDVDTIAKNNISYNNIYNYGGTFNVLSTNNLSGPTQVDAPGSASKNVAIVTFIDEDGDDFHLASTDTGAKDYGADLSSDANLSFTTDIDSQTRPADSAWDIGADEVNALGFENIGYSVEVEKTSQNSFNFNACPPDILMPANDLQSVCSELEAKKFPDLAACSGDYLPADQELESSYQAKAPYVLLSWDHMNGAEIFKIYKYEEGQSRTSAQQLAEFSVDTPHLCQGNRCACQDRGAEVKDAGGNYKKFHYFVTAEGPGGTREFDFPSSTTPAALHGYQLNCSGLTQESIYLSPSCENNNPGTDIFLKSAVPFNIASYWNGKDSKLVVAGGNDSIISEGPIIGDSNGIASDQGGATQIGASATDSISWSVLNNFIDADCAVTPCSLSLWVKFNQTTTPSTREAIFFDKAETETSNGSLSSFFRLSREQFGLWQTASKSIDDGLIKAVNSSNQTQDTDWHHLKANWFNEGGSKKIKFWFDFNLAAESLDTIASFKLKDPIEQRRVYLGSNISDLATTEAIVDEVYLGEDAGNNPYYYEIFRKGPADTKYKYVATLDSNAFLWSESVFSNNLIAGQAYAYKIRVNPTQSNLTSLIIDPQGSLGDNQVKLATDCNVPSGPGPFNLHSSSVLCDELGNAQIELAWYDTKKPTQADNNYQIKVYRQLAAGQNIFYNFELSPDQSIPDADGNYCKTEGITDPNAQIECHYHYAGASFAEYDFQVFRQLESDEAGFPDSAIAYLSDVATPKCYSEDPTDFSLSALIGCCSDGASCVDGGQAAAVSLTWQDADYTGKYAVYRDCNSENIADCSTLVREVYDSDICVGGTKNGLKCLIDTDCPGGSCGPAVWQIIDSGVGFEETHTYQVFAIGKSNKPDNSPDNPVTTPTFGPSGCFFMPTQPEILNIKRSCFGGAATHEIRWDYAESYGQEQAIFGDPNPNTEIDYWVVYARENGSDFNQLLGVINAPPSVSNYPFHNTLLSANNTYNYKIYAVDTNDIWSKGSLPWDNPNHPGEDLIAPICTNPPRKDLKNFRIVDYSQCTKITFQFDIDSQSIPPDDLAEGYEFYRLTDSPDLTNYYYSNCQYDADETLGCNYSTNCPYSPEECAVYHKNKKISDQIAHGLGGSQLINIQSRNLTSYVFSDSAFTPGQTYFWAATSYNSIGYSTSTADNIFGLASGGFQTRQCAQSPEKSNVTAIAKCPATVILSWLNPADSSVTYYNIYRRRLEDANFTLVKEKQEACVKQPEATEDCRNTYEDMPGALTDIYKYRIVSVNSQQIEVDGVPTIFYVEGNYVEKNARACFKLPRWQELPGITP